MTHYEIRASEHLKKIRLIDISTGKQEVSLHVQKCTGTEEFNELVNICGFFMKFAHGLDFHPDSGDGDNIQLNFTGILMPGVPVLVVFVVIDYQSPRQLTTLPNTIGGETMAKETVSFLQKSGHQAFVMKVTP